MSASVVWVAVCLGSAARADIAPIPPPGAKFIDFTIAIEGLDDKAGFVIVGWDDPYNGEIERHAAFLPGDASRLVASGRGRHNLGAPSLYLLAKVDYAKWSAATEKKVEEERDACFQRHEGCAHPSRFVAHYAPPKGAIDCGTKVEVVTSVPTDGPDHLVRRWRVVEASAKVCKLAALEAAPEPTPTPAPADPAPSAAPDPAPAPAPDPSPAPATAAAPRTVAVTPATTPVSKPAGSKGCASGEGSAELALGLLGAGWLARRRARGGAGKRRTRFASDVS